MGSLNTQRCSVLLEPEDETTLSGRGRTACSRSSTGHGWRVSAAHLTRVVGFVPLMIAPEAGEPEGHKERDSDKGPDRNLVV